MPGRGSEREYIRGKWEDGTLNEEVTGGRMTHKERGGGEWAGRWEGEGEKSDMCMGEGERTNRNGRSGKAEQYIRKVASGEGDMRGRGNETEHIYGRK